MTLKKQIERLLGLQNRLFENDFRSWRYDLQALYNALEEAESIYEKIIKRNSQT